jgi:tRNA(Ile)-lysidine synthase
MSIELRMEQYIRQEGLLDPGDSVIVAVSGGPDSTAMLHLLRKLAPRWQLKLHVAHMDHGFRGEESRREAEWVASLADELGLECTVKHADVPALAAEAGGNAQELAREVRYAFLLETARRVGAGVIALGHHADDQAETILMKLIRGASLSGLSGMSPVSVRQGVKLVRPLLRIYKEEIVTFLQEHGYGYCEDSSNLTRKYARNRLRLDVLPMLRSFNPELAGTLGRMADILRDEDRFLHRLAEDEAKRLFRCSAGSCAGSRERFLKLDVALQRRVIKLILSYLCENQEQAESIHIEQVREAIRQAASPSIALDLPGARFMREYDELRFTAGARPSDSRAYQYTVPHPDYRLMIEETGVELHFRQLARAELAPFRDGHGIDERSAYFDRDAVVFPLTVRSRLPGDRIQLPNLPGTKKLKELFIDLKVPVSVRDKVPCIVDGEGRLLWVCGIRRSRHAPVTDETKSVLSITLDSE